MNRITANGQEFYYLSAGAGPKVLLLHGFPDIASTWSFQMDALAQAGYCAIAPYLRGYHPNPIQAGAFYDKATLVQDLACLIEALGDGEPLFFIGQDWGAIIGYALCSARPDLIKKAVLMAVPHPAIVARHLLDPKHVQRSFHWWFFQQPDFPEQALMADDMAFIDFLWRDWCAPGYEDWAHIQAVKACLQQPGVLPATLAYYRAMFNPQRADPALASLRADMGRTIAVPTLALCGAQDLRAELMVAQEPYFSGGYQYREVPKAGHFLHREQPAAVNRLLLDWLGAAN
jgi:pimeloyl-ACP methyl ester carboxylesterase